jgi:serine/threonine protein kinase
MVYEFVCCNVPFGEEFDTPYEVYEAVLNHHLKFSSSLKPNFPSKSLIQTLLEKNPTLRGDPKSLKNHEYFRNFNWNRLINHEIDAPLVSKETLGALQPAATTLEEMIAAAEKNELAIRGSPNKAKPPRNWDENF